MTLKTQFLHFDSANATYLTNITNTSGCPPNPYLAQYAMNQTFPHIRKVFLKSLELPMGITNIRTGSTDTLIFSLNGTTYSIVLPEKNYFTVISLLADINTACVGKVSNVNIVFNVSTSLTTPSRLVINFSGSVPTTSFSIIDTNLSKFVLGFRGATDSLVSSVYTAFSSNYNLNYDNYINMYIPTLNCMNASMSNQVSTFKIPLNSICNQIYYYQESSSFSQWVDIYDDNLRFTNIIVILTDRFGMNINPNGLDYSFTLMLEYEN